MKNPRVSKKLAKNIDTVKFRSILIIDDTEIDLFIAKRTLIMNNYADTIYTETSGRSALHFLENTKKVPDLILVDFLMPEMNGLDFIAEFHKLPPHITETCKIVLLSAYIKFYDEEMLQVMGFEKSIGILAKPLNIIALAEIADK